MGIGFSEGKLYNSSVWLWFPLLCLLLELHTKEWWWVAGNAGGTLNQSIVMNHDLMKVLVDVLSL